MSDENAGVAAALAAALTALTAVYTALGVTNVLGAMARNHSGLFGIAAVAAVLAIFLGIVGGYLKQRDLQQRVAFGLGLAALLASGVSAAIGATLVWSDTGRPRIDTALTGTSDARQLQFQVRVDGLSVRDHLRVTVDTVPSSKQVPQGEGLYAGSTGPNSSGEGLIDETVALPPGTYRHASIQAWVNDEVPRDCSKPRTGTGCALLVVTPSKASP